MFSPELCGLNCALLCDSSLLIMSGKVRNQKFSVVLKKGKVNFMLEAILSLRTKDL